MQDQIAEHVKELLGRGEIAGFLALRRGADGHIGPYLFRRPDELRHLSLGDRHQPGDSRYPLPKLISRLLAAEPQARFGILVRGCEERALLRLMSDDRVHPVSRRRVVMVGFACPAELAQSCQCQKPWPDHLVAGRPAPPAPPPPEPEGDLAQQLEDWFQICQRCLKCFGCRDVCPVCSCLECTLEEESFLPQRELPPDRHFLLTRAVHMIDRCVYCGLCEMTCPAHIPLKGLYRLVARLMAPEAAAPQPLPGAAQS